MKPIEPFEAGASRTILTVDDANMIADAANGINAIQGGKGIKVTHSDFNIHVERICPTARTWSVNERFPYYHVYPGPPWTGLICPPNTGVPANQINYISSISSYRIGASETFNLLDYFPYSIFHDGTCPIGLRVGSISGFPQNGSDGTTEPGSGNYTITDGTDTTAAIARYSSVPLDMNAEAAIIETRLNALNSNTGPHGGLVTVYPAFISGMPGKPDHLTDGLARFYYITWNDFGARAALTPNGGSLNPANTLKIKVVSSGSDTTRARQLMEFGPNLWRDNNGLSMEIGPYGKDYIIFAATNLRADDKLTFSIDGGFETQLVGSSGTMFEHGNPIAYLPAGKIARFRNIETGGAYAWASGVIGIKTLECSPLWWLGELGLT